MSKIDYDRICLLTDYDLFELINMAKTIQIKRTLAVIERRKMIIIYVIFRLSQILSVNV